MELPIVKVDAFASRVFTGNPAAVMRLPAWLPDDTLRAVAAENNLSETAFVVGRHLRWFTPTTEVELCGHATLAAGAVLLEQDGGDRVAFETRSGELVVERDGEAFVLELPAVPAGLGVAPDDVLAAVGGRPVASRPIRALHHASYWLAEYATEAEVEALAPDFRALRGLGANVVATAPGTDVDFVSRFFAPGSGVDEDPVTGSAHCTLTPLWVGRLGRNPLRARQISRRGGEVGCALAGDHVRLSGRVAWWLTGVVRVPG